METDSCGPKGTIAKAAFSSSKRLEKPGLSLPLFGVCPANVNRLDANRLCHGPMVQTAASSTFAPLIELDESLSIQCDTITS